MQWRTITPASAREPHRGNNEGQLWRRTDAKGAVLRLPSARSKDFALLSIAPSDCRGFLDLFTSYHILPSRFVSSRYLAGLTHFHSCPFSSAHIILFLRPSNLGPLLQLQNPVYGQFLYFPRFAGKIVSFVWIGGFLQTVENNGNLCRVQKLRKPSYPPRDNGNCELFSSFRCSIPITADDIYVERQPRQRIRWRVEKSQNAGHFRVRSIDADQ